MNLGVFWSVTVLAAMLAGGALAQTLEVVTQCPPLSPTDGRTPVSNQSLLHFGEVQLGDAPVSLEFKTREFAYVLEDVEQDQYKKAAIQCQYDDLRSRRFAEIRIPIPGLLLSCDRITKVRGGPYPYFPIRFFCISRIKAPAR
ncbi:MAG: hypothetical protein NBV67_12245 [Tagaea sp.]|nr:hypothetical protein [Tagaea sp.]